MLLFVAELKNEITEKLNKIYSEESDRVIVYLTSIKYLKEAINRLKLFINTYQFKDAEEEILFFKTIKPEILSKLIYFNRISNIEIKRPTGSFESQRKHLLYELDRLTIFFNDHIDFYQYYRMNSTSLDEHYFTREKNNIHLYQDSLTYYIENEFSTSHDILLANIKANDKIESYIKKELEILAIKEQNPNWEQLGNLSSNSLQWTDSKTALVELIYALHSTGSVNNGKTEIRELTAFFEQIFNIKLTDIYRTYLDIKIRSTPTKYIDTLKTALIKRIEEDL